MNRLTKKDTYINNLTITKKELFDCYEKLEKIENIEEEIGCPLNIVFKALKEEKIYFENGTYSTDFVLQRTPAWAFAIYDNLINNKEIVIIKDYGKTWWLKGEKNE